MKSHRSIAIACGALATGLAAAQVPTQNAPAGVQAARTASKPNWKQMSDVVAPLVADKDPLGRIAGHMGKAADLLARLDTSDPTQVVQKNIITDLDAFIEELEKRKKNGKAGGGDPNSPLPDSILAGGPGGQGNLHDANASARLWGQLPPKQRDQILQSQNEGFPPGYESILSSYYKRLAQENTGEIGDVTASSAGPSTRPAEKR